MRELDCGQTDYQLVQTQSPDRQTDHRHPIAVKAESNSRACWYLKINAYLGLSLIFSEQEFAKNVIKTAEGAKTNVGHQVNRCFLMSTTEKVLMM